jgi:hypothetical protein
MEPTTSFTSILNLGNDILNETCQILNESVSNSGGQIQRPLHAFSQTSKTLRAISAREVFREIGVICVDWKKAERLVDEMQGCPAITNYTRFVNCSSRFSCYRYWTMDHEDNCYIILTKSELITYLARSNSMSSINVHLQRIFQLNWQSS